MLGLFSTLKVTLKSFIDDGMLICRRTAYFSSQFTAPNHTWTGQGDETMKAAFCLTKINQVLPWHIFWNIWLLSLTWKLSSLRKLVEVNMSFDKTWPKCHEGKELAQKKGLIRTWIPENPYNDLLLDHIDESVIFSNFAKVAIFKRGQMIMIMIYFVAAKNSCDANARQKTKTWTYVKHAFQFLVNLKS